ncbi:16S rRNA (adenine(1518)-N(6)/adenine(1519)-N(6))-dimethyltransferase RsmA [Nannocystis sp.]|uniref:16S rRNA (adenine(1518)-N(6)/adenine(1519)-N(6))- dimethyltransferase RsmA n=1 Tax=Nannocystis sp. TaxID=1962667 RepID=UPI0024239A59|nr:16S rRNA (adenine(1518)-N(6)/adenine(1519)-N(6))-dimethyltransferase RsmA [Nannocystis sp.]MBK7824700.1 ribosomal RNA small subunit methyltransferase A [Nannocystis sp.]MBK9753050.1 ribosomal RNA small subunit methyltransferase A [Nannocystis sp.]
MIDSPGQLLKRHGLHARHSWGQNFLHAQSVHEAIVRASGARAGMRVVEIGAGLGTLTDHLLATGAEVWAIERDRDLCTVLRAELGDRPNLVLHEADAVRFDYAAAAKDQVTPPAIVGNLPYQLTGPLLFVLLDHHAWTGPWVVMVQKEVADRLCSPPGSREYGGVTAVMSRVRAVTRVCAAPRGCFLPPPRVDSAVIRLDPHPQPRGEVADAHGFQQLVRATFQQRRKVLSNALTSLAGRDAALRWCAVAGVDPGIRPERLGPEEFAALQRAREAEGASGDAGAP